MQGINLQCNTALQHITSHCTTIASYYIHCTAIRVGQHQSETVHYPRTCIIRNCIAFLVWRYIALHSTGLQIHRNCTTFKVGQHKFETDHYPQASWQVATSVKWWWPLLFWWEACMIDTCVSALREIHLSLQCKIFQYTFLRQYPMKFQDFLLPCKIYQLVWRQLDYRKLGLWETRLLRPMCHKNWKNSLSCVIHWFEKDVLVNILNFIHIKIDKKVVISIYKLLQP